MLVGCASATKAWCSARYWVALGEEEEEEVKDVSEKGDHWQSLGL